MKNTEHKKEGIPELPPPYTTAEVAALISRWWLPCVRPADSFTVLTPTESWQAQFAEGDPVRSCLLASLQAKSMKR